MSLKVGDQIYKSFSHGEDAPVVSSDSWTVEIEPTKAGGISKMAIQLVGTETKFFIHLNVDKKILFTDNGETFFDFNEKDVHLFANNINN